MKKKTNRTVESMPEALVTLHIAFWLLDHADQESHVEIAIDGHVDIAAHEQNGRWVEERLVFAIEDFLRANECQPKIVENNWRGTYHRKNSTFRITVRGFDVQGKVGGKAIKVECKGGPIEFVEGKSISSIYATAIGQAITTEADSPADEVWVAVPQSASFEAVGNRIVKSPMFLATRIRIALVGKDGGIQFLN